MRKNLFGCLLLGSLVIVATNSTASAQVMDPGTESIVAARKLFGFSQREDGEPAIYEVFVKILLIAASAIACGAVLAYHPCHIGKPTSLGAMDSPKIIITYTVVGALCGILVGVNPALGFAIFGIGGLMRFRTDLGAARETGRVILATLIGIFCGMEFWIPVICATVIAWLLILVLDWNIGVRMMVRGLKAERVKEAALAYRSVLEKYQIRITLEKKNPKKGQISFVFRANRSFDKESVEEDLEENVDESLQGTVDWPED